MLAALGPTDPKGEARPLRDIPAASATAFSALLRGGERRAAAVRETFTKQAVIPELVLRYMYFFSAEPERVAGKKRGARGCPISGLTGAVAPFGPKAHFLVPGREHSRFLG